MIPPLPTELPNAITTKFGSRLLILGASSSIAALAVFARETTNVRVFGGTSLVDAFYLSIAPLALCMWTFAAIAEVRLVPLIAKAPSERHRELDRLGAKYALIIMAGWLVAAGIVQQFLSSTRMSPLPLMMAIEAPAILAYGLYAVTRSALLASNRLSTANVAAAAGTLCGVALVLLWPRPLSMPLAYVMASWIQAGICLAAVELLSRKPARERLDQQPGLGRLSVALVLSGSVTTVDRAVASVLGPGAVTAITIADRLYQLPATIAAAALSNAVFPTLARLRSGVEFSRFAKQAVGVNLAITLPLATAGALFAADALQVVAGSAFAHSENRAGVILAITLLFVAVPVYSLSVLYTRILLGAGAERYVALQGVLSFGLNVIGDLLGALVFGLAGIAAATVAVYVLSDAYLFYHLRRVAWPKVSIRAATLGTLGFKSLVVYSIITACMIAVRVASLGIAADILLACTLSAIATGGMLAAQTSSAGWVVRRLRFRRDRPQA